MATIKKESLTEEKLIELYDSHGITPTQLAKKGLIKSVPVDFYVKLAEKHEHGEQKAQTKKEIQLNLKGVADTKKLYYDGIEEFKAKVLKVIDGRYVILDRTAFYPTGGGQLCDEGTLKDSKVISVFRQSNVIIHEVASHDFKVGDTISGKVNKDTRKSLKQHHTATHLINGAARSVLGEHIWQAGSQVTSQKARLDITHYASLSEEELKKIENKANEAIKKAIRVEKLILPKDKAEKKYGFRLYQGGAVPGAELRVIKIGDFDVEACGGLHADNTKEVEKIKIVNSKRIQDGVIRLEYVAGRYAEKEANKHAETVEKVLLELGADGKLASALVLQLPNAAKVFSVQPEQLVNTVKRFVSEVKNQHAQLKQNDKEFFEKLKQNLEKSLDLPKALEELFGAWKKNRKEMKKQ